MKETRQQLLMNSIIYKKKTIYSFMLQSLESLKTINHHHLLKKKIRLTVVTELKSLKLKNSLEICIFYTSQRILNADLMCLTYFLPKV